MLIASDKSIRAEASIHVRRYSVEAFPVSYANPAPIPFFLHQVDTAIRTCQALQEGHRGFRFSLENYVGSSGEMS
jgi:hypothetical protein